MTTRVRHATPRIDSLEQDVHLVCGQQARHPTERATNARMAEPTMVAFDVRDGIGWLELRRPEKLNAMSPAFWDEIAQVLVTAESDPAVRAVVLHGAGRCFSVGADIEAFAEARGDEATSRQFAQRVIGGLLAVEEARVPTIAAVHGHALGGGCELTTVCDIVVADETARFGMPEARIGLVPGVGILRAPAHINLHWLKYMVMTAEPLDAEQARLAGLVQFVVPPGEHLAEAERLARLIAANSATAVEALKSFYREDVRARFPDAVDLIAALQQTDDVAAGIAAFVARRTDRA
jgi:enoyl-CoA hydratase/carnithine racemase